MQSLEIKENEKILIIAPHPDDECIGAGGILLRYTPQCDVIVLTDGRQGQGDVPPEEGKRIRKSEFLCEMESLGVKNSTMLDIEDGMLLTHTDCLVNYNFQDYDKVFVTGLEDGHPDHKAAFSCVRNWAEKHVNKRIPQCFVYEVHKPLQNPTHFTDITEIMQDKQDLIRFHKSQLGELPYDILAMQCASYRATLNRMPTKMIEVYQEIDLARDVDDSMSEKEALLQKERVNGWVVKRWLQNKIDGKLLSDYLRRKGLREIYIYGFGDLGKLLNQELLNSDVTVKAFLDRRADQFNDTDIPVILTESASDRLPVIVTVIYEYEKIKIDLERRGFNKVLSLKSAVEGI